MINYDLTKIKGIAFDVDGVLSPSVVPMYPNGEPMRMVNIKDGYAMQLAVRRGLRLAIISGARTQAVETRFQALGLQDLYMSVPVKLPVFEQWCHKCGFVPDEVAFVGDDIPDIPALKAAGLAVVPADGAPECQAVADYVSPHPGGHGVARELLEAVLKAQNRWLEDEHAFGW